jgi:hypothetical protein
MLKWARVAPEPAHVGDRAVRQNGARPGVAPGMRTGHVPDRSMFQIAPCSGSGHVADRGMPGIGRWEKIQGASGTPW